MSCAVLLSRFVAGTRDARLSLWPIECSQHELLLDAFALCVAQHAVRNASPLVREARETVEEACAIWNDVSGGRLFREERECNQSLRHALIYLDTDDAASLEALAASVDSMEEAGAVFARDLLKRFDERIVGRRDTATL